MAVATCAISGLPLREPVVSSKTGHVFEKALILKQIAATGQCPVTGNNLAESDLITLSVEQAAEPRALTTTSVPGLLGVMQSEWDTLLLESFKLRSSLDRTRQELSHALHQYDAACRVICRLIKERDEARKQLAQLDDARQAGGEEEAKVAPEESFTLNLERTHDALTEARRAKQIPPPNNVPDARYSKGPAGTQTIAIKEAQQLETVDIDPTSRYALAGGAGGCFVYDMGSQKQVYSFTKHSAPITDACFNPHQAQADRVGVLMASRDGKATLTTYTPEESYNTSLVLADSTSPLLACCFTTLSDYALFGAEDGKWRLHQIINNQTLATVEDPNASKGGISALRIHPDGILLATGSASGIVNLWDLRSNDKVGALQTAGGVSSIAFSNKGINLVSTHTGTSSFALWDVRKLADTAIEPKDLISFKNITQARGICYDISGKLAVVAGEGGMELYKTKGWKQLNHCLPKSSLGGVMVSGNGEIVATVGGSELNLSAF